MHNGYKLTAMSCHADVADLGLPLLNPLPRLAVWVVRVRPEPALPKLFAPRAAGHLTPS